MGREQTGDEKRIRRLEEEQANLKQALDALKHRVGQAAEELARQNQDDGAAGRLLIRAQSIGVITGSTGSALGTGTVRPLQVIAGVRYKTQPIADGDITLACVNDTGAATVNNEYLICAYVDGLLTALVGDCATMSPTIAPDPPDPPEEEG